MPDERASSGGPSRLGVGGPLLLVSEEELHQRVREYVREELRVQGVGLELEWGTRRQAGAIAGVGPSTIGEWMRRGYLTRGRRGRVNLAELRAFLARSGRPTPAAGPLDLGRERARRAAAEILRGKGAR